MFAAEKFSNTNFFQRFPVLEVIPKTDRKIIPKEEEYTGLCFQYWKLLPKLGKHTFTFAGTGVRMEEAAINRRTYVLFLGHNLSGGRSWKPRKELP